MKSKAIVIGILAATVCVFGCKAGKADIPVLKGPYLGQRTPGITPEVFAPGIISTGLHDDYGPAISKEGDEIFFRIYGKPHPIICVTECVDGKWIDPEVASFSGQYADGGFVFAKDGGRLYFESDRPLENTKEPKDTDIWFVDRTGNVWGKPKNLGLPVNSSDDEYLGCISADNTIYFTIRKRDGEGKVTFINYSSRLSGGTYSKPEILPYPFNSDYFQTAPVLSPDETYAIFAMNGRADSHGQEDLYVTFKKRDDTWTEPKNLGVPVNSNSTDWFPSFSPDGKYLFFVSWRYTGEEYSGTKRNFKEMMDYYTSPVYGHGGDVYWVDTRIIEDLKTLKKDVSGTAKERNRRQLTKKQWLEDLDFVMKTLIDKHPDVFYRIGEEEFNRTAAKAKRQINRSQTDEECFVAIRQVVASIRDGHTSLSANNLPGYRDIFPVRMYEFYDGIFITGIAEKYKRHVGSKVIKIGRLSAEEAFRRAGTLTFADNDFSKKNQAPAIVIACRLAHGLGITERMDRLSLFLEAENGEHEEIVIFPSAPAGANNMLRGMDIGPDGIPFSSAFTGTPKQIPMYLRHLDGNHNYWFEHDRENKAIFMQFNLVVHHRDETFDEFYKRMFNYIDSNAKNIDKFVLDLRFNSGGNGLMVLPFINEIIKRDKINRLGHLYVLIGRRSFSAAVLLVAEMMLHTRALIVGEPAGAAQNMFSDIVNGGTLPNSGITLFLSSEYFNIAWPANKSFLIPPHYPAPFSSSDFFSGKDPALEAIFADKVKAVEMVFHEEGQEAALNFFDEIFYNWDAHTDEWGILPFTFPISKKYTSEYRVLTEMLKRRQHKK